MPKSPDLPAFCKFNYFVMFECVCAIAVSCLLIAFYHMNVNIELPDWVKVSGYLSLLITCKIIFFLTILSFILSLSNPITTPSTDLFTCSTLREFNIRVVKRTSLLTVFYCRLTYSTEWHGWFF